MSKSQLARIAAQQANLREYLAANMFDGDGEAGIVTMRVKTLLDNVVELVVQYNSERLSIARRKELSREKEESK